MKKILLVLFLFLAGSFSLANAKEVKFIFLSDAGVNKQNAYQLKDTIKEINSYKDVDFVVFGGNNINKAQIVDLDYFAYLLKRVHKKTYVLLGNQDVSTTSGIDKKYYMKRVKRARFYRHPSKSNYVFKKKGYVFVAMDGSKQYFRSSNGYYSKAELIWLEGILKKYKNSKVVILQHFPLTQTKSQWLQTAKTEDYLELLKKYDNVKVIVSGHYGANTEDKILNISNILVENYSKNQAYKIIQMDLDKDFIGTYLVK